MVKVCCAGRCFEPIEAIILDKDGTLAVSEPYLLRLAELRSHYVLNAALSYTAEQSCDISSESLKARLLKTLGVTTQGIHPAGLVAVGSQQEDEIALAGQLAMLGIPWVSARNMVHAAFERASLEASQQADNKSDLTSLLPGTLDFLVRSQNFSLQLAIVSSDTQIAVEQFIAHYQLPNVQWRWGAQPGRPIKTAPGFLDRVCAQMEVRPNQTLVIGDAPTDLALANQGAAGFIGVTGGWHISPSFDVNIPCCSTLSEVEIFH